MSRRGSSAGQGGPLKWASVPSCNLQLLCRFIILKLEPRGLVAVAVAGAGAVAGARAVAVAVAAAVAIAEAAVAAAGGVAAVAMQQPEA